MTERQQLIARKIQALSVKRALARLSGIDIIGIANDKESGLLRELYAAYTPVMCSYETVPYSRISYQAAEEQVISWIIASMGLKERERYFLNCKGTWAGIRFLNLHDGVQSLWNHGGLSFMLADSGLTRIMEASFDSRDEEHYLVDIWDYNRQDSGKSSKQGSGDSH